MPNTPNAKHSRSALLPHLNEIKQRMSTTEERWFSSKDPMIPIAAYIDGTLAPHHIFVIKTFCQQQQIPYHQDESGLFVNLAAFAIAIHLTCGFR